LIDRSFQIRPDIEIMAQRRADPCEQRRGAITGVRASWDQPVLSACGDVGY
jgi:hypothetical protein